MNINKVIYADCAAQSRPRPEAIEAARNTLELYGNPSGVHRSAKAAARVIFEARGRVARAINARPSEIYFVSSATEANNTVILSAAREGVKQGRNRILVFAGEHHAVLYAARNAAALTGTSVEYVPCRTDGIVDLAAFEKMCAKDVCLCALMTVNNETGVIQPVADFRKIAHACGALFLTDAAQSVGHIPADVEAIGCDFLSMSAHKFGGYAGAGALFCRNGLSFLPLICGGGQENHRRSGTEALLPIAAMGAAIEAAIGGMEHENSRIREMRDLLEKRLSSRSDIMIIGSDAPRIDSTLCVCLKNTDGEAFALYLNMEGICVSSGAACTTGEDAASHVLTAMGVSPEYIRGSLRFSFDAHTTEEEIERIAETVDLLMDKRAAAKR